MNLQEHEGKLVDLVRSNLSPRDLADCRAYYDTDVINAGEPVRIGRREVPMPFRGIRVFVDLMPHANWGHRVAYLLASQDLSHCVVYQDQFPPFSDELPEHWRALPSTA